MWRQPSAADCAILRRPERKQMQRRRVYTDSQTALWSVTKAEGRKGAYMLEEIAYQIRDLWQHARSLTTSIYEYSTSSTSGKRGFRVGCGIWICPRILYSVQ
jgi:hypothetical protein